MGVGQARRMTNTPSGEKGCSERGRAGELRCQAERALRNGETWRKLGFVIEVRNVAGEKPESQVPKITLNPEMFTLWPGLQTSLKRTRLAEVNWTLPVPCWGLEIRGLSHVKTETPCCSQTLEFLSAASPPLYLHCFRVLCQPRAVLGRVGCLSLRVSVVTSWHFFGSFLLVFFGQPL